ncbi:efflux RND transporter periplasmic adaptor subunit [Haliangium ochraceum]|uniref:Efflux transporter, RND family, MFP subunit n=1 Tax=Haliangium ochraceum (strain DSM 14365 / JCM 11303 / SMP-2) TaxID=502025 RepID=D0LKL8_HALO1|nr:efflux RND transporter periplasmic adaptor subunit [Haliangium ochraceum]ACY15066.1 efflux transporter, RND family, MFP subunit [Haliangium ochraceum DSM 14365]
MLKRTAARLVAIGLTALLASGCRGEIIDISSEDAGVDDPVPVEVVTLATGPIEDVLRFSANLEAEDDVQVLARAPGLVRQVLVEEGDRVAQGAVLVRLEDEEQRTQLARAKNDLARAERELALQTAMHERGVTSEQALESAQYERTRLALMRDDAARALRYTTVRAPIAGTITQRLVKRGDNVTVQQPLFQLTDFGSLVARVYVPEKKLDALGAGQQARITAPATGEAEHSGTVERIAPLVDPQSGTVKVTINVPGARAASLFPGMFVDVALVTERREDAVLLPKRALVYDNDIAYAFKLVEGKRAARVRVEPALESRFFVQPDEGFDAGDQVIIAGQVGLKDDAEVEPRPAPTSAQSPGTPDAKGEDATDAAAPAPSADDDGDSDTDSATPRPAPAASDDDGEAADKRDAAEADPAGPRAAQNTTAGGR